MISTLAVRPDTEDDVFAPVGATETSHPPALGSAQPIAFDGCFGVFHPAAGTTGIVICSPWGYDELVVRAAFRHLAEGLAEAGFPTLRFDYPATGNSLGDGDAVCFADWVTAARRAADLLNEAGARNIVFLGHGFGTIVAQAAAVDRTDVAGLVLMAATTARRFLRESAHLAAMLASGEQVAGPKRAGLNVAGFDLPQHVFADLKALAEPLPTPPWVALVEPDARRDDRAADALVRRGALVERLPYTGFDALVDGPTTSVIPEATFTAVVASLRQRFPLQPMPLSAQQRGLDHPPHLRGDGFDEQAVTFGKTDDLFGILCTPHGVRDNRIVLFLNTGRNPHTGWRRMSVDHARALAAVGIASLRFDLAGVGESPRCAGRPNAFLFTAHPVADVAAACDAVIARDFDDISLVGVCSGAYLGLLASVADARVKRLFAVNLPRFAWALHESIDDAIRFANRPATQMIGRLRQRGTLRLILTGRLDPRPAIAFKLRAFARRLGVLSAPALRSLSPAWEVYGPAHARVDTLAKRGTALVLGYGEHDGGWREMEMLFGRNGRRLPGRKTTVVEKLTGVDHNLTQVHASDWLLAQIRTALAPQR